MMMKRMKIKEVSHIYLTEFSLLLNYLSREERQRKEDHCVMDEDCTPGSFVVLYHAHVQTDVHTLSR